MRFSGKALGLDDISKASILLAAEDTSSWPSINDPVRSPSSTDVYYDEKMGILVPIIPKA